MPELALPVQAIKPAREGGGSPAPHDTQVSSQGPESSVHHGPRPGGCCCQCPGSEGLASKPTVGLAGHHSCSLSLDPLGGLGALHPQPHPTWTSSTTEPTSPDLTNWRNHGFSFIHSTDTDGRASALWQGLWQMPQARVQCSHWACRAPHRHLISAAHSGRHGRNTSAENTLLVFLSHLPHPVLCEAFTRSLPDPAVGPASSAPLAHRSAP